MRIRARELTVDCRPMPPQAKVFMTKDAVRQVLPQA